MYNIWNDTAARFETNVEYRSFCFFNEMVNDAETEQM